MKFFKSYSGVVLMLVFASFVYAFSGKIKRVINEEDTCVCAYDGFGYYMYLPYFFEHGSLTVKHDWAQQLQDEYCDGLFVYQIINYKGRGEVNIYHMGLAYLQLPAYTVGHVAAKILGYKQNGMTKPYHLAYILNALLFIFLGLLYLRKLLLLFVNDKLAALSLLMLFLASNAFMVFLTQHQLPHLYLFGLNAAFLYYLVVYYRSEGCLKPLIISAVLLGITSTVRPTQALLGLIPIVLLYQKHHTNRKIYLKRLLWYPAFGVLWNLPQFMYWWVAVDSPFVFNMHTEDIVLSDPNLFEFLVSYKKGWLLYSPIFLLLIPAFWTIYKKHRLIFNATFYFFLCYVYVMSAWECWWYAASYGARVMADIYPVLLVLIALYINSMRINSAKWLLGMFILLCISLNITQSIQFKKRILHFDRMTKEHYWYIFGKRSMPNFSDKRLELDRSTTDWINHPERLPNDVYEIEEKIIFFSDSLYISPDTQQEYPITKRYLFEHLSTDESLIEVTIKTRTSDSTQNATLHMQTESKYNRYGWQSIEVSKGYSEHDFTEHTHKFNLPNIRHKGDWLNIYVKLPGKTIIEVKELKIKAYSLIRK